MSDTSPLFSQAMALPDHERAELAHHLILSLETESETSAERPSLIDEVVARHEQVRQGNYSASDWREAIDRIRKSLPFF